MLQINRFSVSSACTDLIFSKKIVLPTDIYNFLPSNFIECLYENAYLILEADKAVCCLKYVDGSFHLISYSSPIKGVSPRNPEQVCLLDGLLDPKIQMLTVTGPAGSGKTMLTLAAAMHQFNTEKRYKRIVITKPRTQVTDGDDPIGELPGDVGEKMHPFLMSYELAFAKLFSKNWKEYFRVLLEREEIKVIPLEYMRGIDLSHSFVICDEAQNMGPNQYQTLVTRIGETSKLVLMGDVDQSDKSGYGREYNDCPFDSISQHPKYRESPITSTVELITSERSELVKLMTEIFKHR